MSCGNHIFKDCEIHRDLVKFRRRDRFVFSREFAQEQIAIEPDIYCFSRRPAHEATRRRRHRKETRGMLSPRLPSCSLVRGAYRFEVKPSLTWIQRRESQAVARSQS